MSKQLEKFITLQRNNWADTLPNFLLPENQQGGREQGTNRREDQPEDRTGHVCPLAALFDPHNLPPSLTMMAC